MNILVIESFTPMAKAIAEVFEQSGHTVTCVAELDEKTMQAGDINLSDAGFDVALVGNFDGIVDRLVKAGTVCIGMGTMKDVNDRMVALGAVTAVNKAVMFCSLANSLVTIEELKSGNQEALQRLEECRDQFNTDSFKAFRKAGDALLAKHVG